MQNLKSEQNISFSFCDYQNKHHCQKLIELIDHYMADPMGASKPLSHDEHLNLISGLKNHTFSFVLFITFENNIVGLATCFINFSTFKARYYLNIHDLIILPEYRGKGLGRKLLEKCIDISMERGYCKITLEVREDNKNAQLLYKDLGFKDSDPIMHFWTKIL
jgi:ribosomal protein S18 acetylase RimI-like enzyme